MITLKSVKGEPHYSGDKISITSMDYKTLRLADSPNRWNVVNELSKEVAGWVVVADDKRVIAIFGDSYAQLFTAGPQYLCEMTCTYKYYCERSMELLHITSVYTMIVV